MLLSLCKRLPQFLEKNLKIAYKSVFQVKSYGYKIIMSASWSPFRSITSDSACAIRHFDKKSQSNRPTIHRVLLQTYITKSEKKHQNNLIIVWKLLKFFCLTLSGLIELNFMFNQPI